MTGPIRDPALAGLEAAVNRVLALDPAASRRLQALGTHTIHLQCSAPSLDLFLHQRDGHLHLRREHEGPVTTRLRGSGREFLALLGADDPAGVLVNSALRLEGDSAPLLDLQAVLAALEPDWEEPLARLFGDTLAHALGRGLRGGGRWLRDGLRRLNRQSSDFLNYESGWTPPPEEISVFADEVDALALRSERLAARLEQLRRRLPDTREGDN